MGRKLIDMTGQHIGKWTVIEKSNKEATDGVFYNTDVERANLGYPLGEWP